MAGDEAGHSSSSSSVNQILAQSGEGERESEREEGVDGRSAGLRRTRARNLAQRSSSEVAVGQRRKITLNLSSIQQGYDADRPTEIQRKREKFELFDKECSHIVEHVYVGGDSVARNRETLEANGITHVLNCVGFVCPEYFEHELTYKTLWLQDSPCEDITSLFYDVFDYLEEVREQSGRVLVHCCQGVSRSTSLVIAYIMWRYGRSFEDAFRGVKALRGIANPNMGFACQLLQCQERVVNLSVPSPVRLVPTGRIYRIAPHSAYDPLHLVPKTVYEPAGVGVLDSRGAFVVHAAAGSIRVWVGRACPDPVAHAAEGAANQLLRYEGACGPILSCRDGDEPPEFWRALTNEQPLFPAPRGEKRVVAYDADVELYQRASLGGIFPPIPSNAGRASAAPICVPSREDGWSRNGWSRIRRKLPWVMNLVNVVKTVRETASNNQTSTVPSSPSIGSLVSPTDIGSQPDRITPLAQRPESSPVDHHLSAAAEELTLDGQSAAGPPSPPVDALTSPTDIDSQSNRIPPLARPRSSPVDHHLDTLAEELASNGQSTAAVPSSPYADSIMSPADIDSRSNQTLPLAQWRRSSPGDHHLDTIAKEFASNGQSTAVPSSPFVDYVVHLAGIESRLDRIPSLLAQQRSSPLDHDRLGVVGKEEKDDDQLRFHRSANRTPTPIPLEGDSCSSWNTLLPQLELPGLYKLPSFAKKDAFGACDLDSSSVFVIVGSSKTQQELVAYVWLGNGWITKRGSDLHVISSTSISSSGSGNKVAMESEEVQEKFGLQEAEGAILFAKILTQVVREGQEPDEFWDLFARG